MREPSTQFHKAAAGKPAFTLVEMLVSMTVLIMLLVMVTQLVNSASQVTTQSTKRVDADLQARMLFNRMGADFAKIVQRTDIDTLVDKQNGNDRVFFFSDAPAYYDSGILGSDKSTASLIGYRVTDQYDAGNFAPAYSLERFGKGLTWSGAPGTSGTAPGSMAFILPPATTSTNSIACNWSSDITYATGSNNYYHVLADQVFRMEICFLVKNVTSANPNGLAYSNYPVALQSGTAPVGASFPAAPQTGDRWYNTTNHRAYLCTSGTSTANPSGVWQPNGLKDVSGVVATIAVLGNTTRKNLANTADLTPLVGLFPDPTASQLCPASAVTASQLPAQIWNAALNTALNMTPASFFSTYGIPKSAGSQIRIYQRNFPVNPTLSK